MNLLAIVAGVAVLSAAVGSAWRRPRSARPQLQQLRPPPADVALKAPAAVDPAPLLPPPRDPVPDPVPDLAPTPPPSLLEDPVPDPVPALAPGRAARPRKPSRRRTQVAPDVETLSDLLERLDDSFAFLQIPPIRGNWLPKADIRALEKMGVHVPNPWGLEKVARDNVTVDTSCLPNIASAHMIPGRCDTEEHIHPRFIFALREPRLPPSVEQVKGTPYRFGMSLRLTERPHDKDSPPRSFWVWAWTVVTPSGHVVIPSERRPQRHTIRHRRNQGTGRTSTFVAPHWQRPTMALPDPRCGQQAADHEYFLELSFRQLLKWWTSRAERWSVAVKKGERRVTFSIEPEHTSAYFADRNKAARAPDGTPKKIIHFVREHTRVNGSVVREHVRGLREFEWRGYWCSVTAPKLTGSVHSATFTLAPTDEDELPGVELADAPTVAAMLAAAEDTDTRPLRSRRRRAA